MFKKNSHEVCMTSGPVLPNLLAMTIPLALSSVFQFLFNAADLVVVGNFASEHSLAAVGSTCALMNLNVSLFVGVSLGANALIARYLGGGDDARVKDAIRTSYGLALLSGVLMTTAGLLLARPALELMQSPAETLDLSTTYYQICSLGMIPMMFFNFGSAILRAKGDTRRPLYFLLAAGVLNFALNFLFVKFLHMDVVGAAIATAISQGLSACLIIRCLSREEGVFKMRFRDMQLSWRTALSILRIGVPAGFQGVVFSLSNIVIQSSINGFGPLVMASSAAAMNLEGIVWLTMSSFSQCALTFMSQNIGARRYSRLNRVAFVSCASCAVAGLVLGNLAYLFGPTLLGLFDSRPEVVESGMIRVFWVCCFYFLCGLMDTLCGVVRGLGHNVSPTIVALVGACGFRLLWIFTIFQVERFHTESVLFFSYPASWILTFVIHLGCYILFRRNYPQGDGSRPQRLNGERANAM